MWSDANPGALVLAEDDDDDFLLIQEAFAAVGFHPRLERVKNGEDLLAYSCGLTGKLPSLLLLDLNMPRKDGREVLREMREDLVCARCP